MTIKKELLQLWEDVRHAIRDTSEALHRIDRFRRSERNFTREVQDFRHRIAGIDTSNFDYDTRERIQNSRRSAERIQYEGDRLDDKVGYATDDIKRTKIHLEEIERGLKMLIEKAEEDERRRGEFNFHHTITNP
jgi:hypothetical protein